MTESSAAVDPSSVDILSINKPCSLSMGTAGQLTSTTCTSLLVLLDEAVSKVDLPYTTLDSIFNDI